MIEEGTFAKKYIHDILIENNERYVVDNHLLIDLKNNELIFASKNINTVLIPEDILKIAPFAFEHCNIESLNTNLIKKLDDYALSRIKHVNRLIINQHVDFIGKNILKDSEVVNLKVPFIGSNLDSANQKNESMNHHLTYLFGEVIPQSLIKIIVTDQTYYDKTFEGCENIEEIIISNNATHWK